MPSALLIERQVFILTSEVRTSNGRSNIIFYGASDEGPVKVIAPFEPYYFVQAKGSELMVPHSTISDDHYLSLAGEDVRRVSFRDLNAAEHARTVYAAHNVVTFESDIRPRDRFFMDAFINGSVRIRGMGVERNGVTTFNNPEVSPSDARPNFCVCSLDIETSISTDSILSIALHISGAKDAHTVLMRGEGPASDDVPVEYCDDEARLLNRFVEWVKETDPDIIIGWNVIGFDLRFLLKRAQHLKMPLRIGREEREFSVSEEPGRFQRAAIPGRVVLDGPQLLRASFYTFESYSLESVSQSVLGKGKLIASTPSKAWEIERQFRDDKLSLARYNLLDTTLVTDIFQRLELLELTVRRSQISGMAMDNVGMSIASMDHFLVPRLHQHGYVAPNRGADRYEGASSGGYVISPQAGLYDGILGFDFQSLYPSIIRTFLIDPLSRACADKEPIVTPSGHSFSRTRHILPDFIGDLMTSRAQARKDGNKALSQAIKILMNSFYGVMGTPSSRLFQPALPDAITQTGQWVLLQSKEWFEQQGHTVIYGDTDSLFVRPKADADKDQGMLLASNLTQYWRDRLQFEFQTESFLVLELKKVYEKFVVPVARGREGGTKKRYAGYFKQGEQYEIEFVGLEAIRSDSTPLAREFQIELYTRIFEGQDTRLWIRTFVDQLRSGMHDTKLIYRKKLHKPANQYGSSPPPYVRAALLLEKPTRLVRYVITKKGPIPIEREPRDPDYDHYITRQLKPVADALLQTIGSSFDELLYSQQLKLF